MMLCDVITLLEGIQLFLFDHPSSLETMFVYHMISVNCCPARKLIGSQHTCLDQFPVNYVFQGNLLIVLAISTARLMGASVWQRVTSIGRSTVQYMFIMKCILIIMASMCVVGN